MCGGGKGREVLGVVRRGGVLGNVRGSVGKV